VEWGEGRAPLVHMGWLHVKCDEAISCRRPYLEGRVGPMDEFWTQGDWPWKHTSDLHIRCFILQIQDTKSCKKVVRIHQTMNGV